MQKVVRTPVEGRTVRNASVPILPLYVVVYQHSFTHNYASLVLQHSCKRYQVHTTNYMPTQRKHIMLASGNATKYICISMLECPITYPKLIGPSTAIIE
jgi:hypothetical protein